MEEVARRLLGLWLGQQLLLLLLLPLLVLFLQQQRLQLLRTGCPTCITSCSSSSWGSVASLPRITVALRVVACPLLVLHLPQQLHLHRPVPVQ